MIVRYTLDPEPGRFTVQAFATGMLSGFAHSPTFAIRDFQGEMRFTPDTFDNASLEITVQSQSLTLTDNLKEKDAREIQRTLREEVLETAKYPQISFRSTEIATNRIAENWFRVQIKGDMRLHGVTNRQEIDAQLRLVEDGLRLSGEFPLSLLAYRIKRVSALGGMIKVKDELKFAFDLVGRKQDEQEHPGT